MCVCVPSAYEDIHMQLDTHTNSDTHSHIHRHRMMKTLFSLPFEHSFENRKLCSYKLRPKDLATLQVSKT